MNDGQKETVNHIYHFLRDLLYKYDIGFYQCNGRKPDDTNLKNMIWYLETNFPKDMLEHEMGDRGFLDEDEEQLSSFDGLLDPVEGGEPNIPEKDRVKCPTCEGCGFEEDENYKHSTCSVCLGMGYIAK